MTTSLVQNSQNSSPSNTTGSAQRPGGFGGAFRGGFNQINTNLTQVTTAITPQVFLSAIGITLLIAIVGSAVPAWFIARIRPAEVLRTE
jgi:ABC-type antimicrobial peptide transport system permease subunit